MSDTTAPSAPLRSRRGPPAGETPPSASGMRPLRGLLPYLRPYRGHLVAALVALTVAAATTLSLPVAVRRMIDFGFSAGNAASIDGYFLALLLLATVLAIATSTRFYLVSWLGERVVADIRSRVFGHMLTLDPGFYEDTRTGEVLSRLTTDTTVLQSAVGSSASVALRNTFLLIGGLGMLVVTSPKLTGLILVLLPLVMLPVIVFGRRVRRLSRDSQDRVADTSALAGEALQGIRIVQAFVQEATERSRFSDAVENAFATARRRLRARAILTAAVIAFVFGSIVLVLWIGAQSVVNGTMSGGQLGQFVLYAVLVAGSAGALSEVWGEMQRAAGAMERIMELLATSPDIADPPSPIAFPPAARGALVFEDVTFAYPARPDRAVVSDVSFTVEPGETVALVGPSGAGKSTMLQLLLRFYDPTSGAIRLDGVDISRALLADLRGRTAIVPQETLIFTGTARENIRYGRPGASDAEVEQAARAAQAEAFIGQLPDGYDTALGERGVRLSGGQRQRIAIARALLRNPPVLLLDEATSALDAESERQVQSALAGLMANRTTLVIAHRLATVKAADRIVVMDQGRIVAQGRHEDLVREGGLYSRLAELQFGDRPLSAPVPGVAAGP